MFINCNGKLLSLKNPIVMGIINLTPDSFYENSRTQNEKQVLTTCERMLQEGASIIDIGGYSSRPGAAFVSEEEEADRTIKMVRLLITNFKGLILSIDTTRSSIAAKAIESGAAIINDISSGEDDLLMMETVALLQKPYIMMHKRGTPKTMQQNTDYGDVTKDVFDYFGAKIQQAERLPIHDMIIDVGFGFAKTTEQNYQLLNALDIFKLFGKPILVGLSRKKMIQHVIQTDAASALNGTSAAHTIALLKGANILRVHDVKEALECINIVRMLN